MDGDWKSLFGAYIGFTLAMLATAIVLAIPIAIILVFIKVFG